MKNPLLKLIWVGGSFLLVCTILCSVFSGCGIWEQRKAEVRIRHYFGLSGSEPIAADVITSNLLSRFPKGTLVANLQIWLAGRGLGADGHSATWQTNGLIGYEVYDYPMAFTWANQIDTWVYFDEKGKIQSVDVEMHNIAL